MARPKKIGLDYFPVDVDFDDKIQSIEMLHGNDGLVWILKFWQTAYKSDDGEVCLSELFGELFTNKCRITTEQHEKILKTAIAVQFCYESSQGNYTSNGIQKRINAVSKDRVSAIVRKEAKELNTNTKNIKQKETPHCSANNTRTIPDNKNASFRKPTLEEVKQHILEKNYSIDAEVFIAHYESNGWKVGKNPMRSWKATLVTWSKNDFRKEQNQQPAVSPSYHKPWSGKFHGEDE